MKSMKKWNIGLLTIMTLVCLMISAIFLLTDSFEYSVKESRKDGYGAWQLCAEDVSEEAKKYLESYPFLSQTGYMSVYGNYYCEDAYYLVGHMDETAWQLSRMKLYEGRLPEREDEVAICYSTLLQMKSELVIGDTMDLNIQSEELHEERKVTLVGILPDYLMNWDLPRYGKYPVVFLGGDRREYPAAATHIFMTTSQNLGEVYKALKEREEFEDGSRLDLIRNTSAYPVKGEDSLLETMHYILTGILILAVFCISITEYASIEKKRDKWNTMFLIGAESHQVIGSMVREVARESLLSLPLGIGLAISLVYGMQVWFAQVPGEIFLVRMVPLHLAITIFLMWVSEFFAFSIASMRILWKIRREMRSNRRSPGFGIKKKNTHRRMHFGIAGFLWIKWRNHPVRTLSTALLLEVLLMASAFSGFEIYKGVFAYQHSLNNIHGTYTCHLPTYSLAQDSLEEELKTIYGVSDVLMYRTRSCLAEEPFLADLEAYDSSDYMTMYLEQMSPRYNDEPKKPAPGQCPVTVIGLPSAQEAKRFVRNLDEGSMDEEAFLRGEEVILVLPMQGYVDDDHIVVTSMQGNQSKGDTEFFLEYSIEEKCSIGDYIDISLGNQTTSVVVGGILREMRTEDYEPFPANAFTLITSNAFWENFDLSQEELGYSDICIQTNGRESYENTDKSVLNCLYSHQGKDIFFCNNRETLDLKRKEMLGILMMYLSIGGLIILFLGLILGMLTRQDDELMEDELNIMEQLGMDPWMKQISRFLGHESMVLIVSLGTYLALRLYWWESVEVLHETVYPIGFPLWIYVSCITVLALISSLGNFSWGRDNVI